MRTGNGKGWGRGTGGRVAEITLFRTGGSETQIQSKGLI